MTEVNHRCAVLGKPIAHSLSPVLHNAAYHALHLDDWSYDKHEVGEPDLEGFLESLDPTWSGLSLTMPLKKTIQPYGTPCNTWAKKSLWLPIPRCLIGPKPASMAIRTSLHQAI